MPLTPHPQPHAYPTPSRTLKLARQQMQDQGQVQTDLINERLSQSWQRSLSHGLVPAGRPPGAPHASAPQLARAMEQHQALVAHARPVMEFLAEQTRDTDSMVILADAQGMLLQALGDAPFLDRAQRVALRPGANWHEQWRGTNAIGTALADAAPIVVHGGEHFLARNGFLTCTAAPIFDPAGRTVGALDISGDHRSVHRHTLGLVRTAANMIEHRLFEHQHAGHLKLRLHSQPEGIATVAEGLVALDDSGRLVGANRQALLLLSLPWDALHSSAIERALQTPLATLWAWARQDGLAPRRVLSAEGKVLWVRAEALQRVCVNAQRFAADPAPRSATQQPPTPQDALGALDTGDATLQAAIERARRVLDKPIAILLQGESGVGKEVLVRALHASARTHSGPLVAVNCAAIPESLIEAELFGYKGGAFTGASREGAPGRIREAHGGTLFLDEIGDMPLAMQARLLRVLQERQVTPLGGGQPVAVSVRLVCATHRQLRAEMQAGRFREDLYYRLNGLTLNLPALRERQDFDDLVALMLSRLCPHRPVSLAPKLRDALKAYRWPGNLRQLHNALQTACALLGDDEAELSWAHLPEDLLDELRPEATSPASAALAQGGLREQARHTVQQVVQACGGNLSEAARQLGISRTTLYKQMGR